MVFFNNYFYSILESPLYDMNLYLIDGHAQIFRAFYAVEGLTTPDGQSIGATFGFTRMLLDLLAHQPLDAVAAAFDSPGKTFRHERFTEYKATRKPTPPELHAQVPLIMDIVKAYGIPVYALPGYEADDILGALTRQGREAGWNVVLVTGDKDCGQLLQDGVSILDPGKNIVTDRQAFIEKKGIEPEKLVDLMGLWGDSADNIPGVPGIGEKIGVQLIKEYGSLENLLDHADAVKGKRGEMLRQHRDQALLSKELATIDQNAPVTLDIEHAQARKPDVEKLRALFSKLGFTSLLRRLDAVPAPPEECAYHLVADKDAFDDFFKQLSRQKRFAFDTETTGLDPLRDLLTGMSFSWNEREAYYLPFRYPIGDKGLSREELERLQPVFADPEIGKTGHNIRYDALVLRHAGIMLKGVIFDSLIASSLLDGHLTDHGLKTLARRHYNVEMTTIDKLIGSGRTQITMDQVAVKDVCDYACADADISWRLFGTLSKRLDERGSRTLFDTVELPLSDVLTEMQATGIRIDARLLAEESAETGELLEDLTKEIHGLAGHPFNIGSPKQLSVVLFEEMNLPIIRKTQTGASTDESVLLELARLHNSEIAERILEYRMYAKLKNTYLDALPKMVNPETGRLHTSFSQTRTATGRLASSNPNLQNIPIRTERGKAVRAAFIPEDGWKMLAADYSQVELRVLAHFSSDPILKKAFEEDMDIHRVVAAEVNGIEPEAVTKEMRSSAKAVNFGIIYGQSAHGLAETTGMSRAQAQRFIDNYYARFPGIRGWMDAALAEAYDKGYVETMLGFRREIPDLASANKAKRARGEREAVNTIIQGSAADLIKTAMVTLHARLADARFQARLLLQIHDELLLECPPGEVEQLKSVVLDCMENAIALSVPLKVDIGVGDNWLETK